MALSLWTSRGDFPSNDLPPDTATSFGGGLGNFLEEGNLFRFASAGLNPSATAADNVLAVYALPASSFDVTGRGINVLAQGSFASSGNVKTVKVIYNATTAVVGSTVTGGTTIASGTTSAAIGGWALEANVFKYGASGSNTQIALHMAFQSGSVVGALASPSLLTATESGIILIAVTGNAATTATDIALNLFTINAMN